MKYPLTRDQKRALESIRARHVARAQGEIEFVCWVCGTEAIGTRSDLIALGWKLGRMRTVRRGLQEQVDLCPRCTLGRGVAQRASAP